MVEAARLVLLADASSLRAGETALDSLARTGGKVEGTLKISAKGIEQAMARIAGVMGGLDTTMQSLQRSVTQSMGRSSQEVSKGARSFDELRRSIDPAYAAAERFADIQQELAGMVATSAASQAQANSVLEIARSRYLGIATAAEAAEQAQRELNVSLAQVTGSYEAVRTAIDPLYASSKRYEAAVEAADAALKAKIITEAQHARDLQNAQTRYLALTPAITGATGGLARFTPQITNASFQIQDFAVQVASGQSALTAFTQQFPQLAGALGVSGKLALLGAGLGTVVAVGAALVPLFASMGNAAKTTEDAVGDLNSAFGAYKSAIEGTNLSVDALTDKFGSNAEAARALYAVMRDLAELELAQAMGAAVAAATGAFGGLGAELDRINALSKASIGDFGSLSAASGRLAGAIGDLTTQYGLGYGQAVELNRAMQALENAKGPQEQARAAAALVEELRDAQRAGAMIPPEIMAVAQQLAQASMLGLQLGGNLDDAAGAASRAAAAARDLASALAAAAGFSMNIDNQIDVIGTRIAAQKAGADAAIAGQIRSMQLEAAASRDRQIAAGVDQFNAEALYQLDLDRIAQLGEMTAQEKALVKATNEAAKGGKKASSEAESAAKKAAKEAEKLNEALDQQAERWRETLDPMAKFRRESEELAKLTGRLSSDEMAKAQRNLNIELADSLPLVGEFTDTMTEGLLNGFKGTLSSVGDMLKRWLANMIAMAAKNRIIIGMGLGGTGGAGAAMAGATGVPGAGGGAGMAAMGGLGVLGGSIMSGASGFTSALSGGLGPAMQYTQFMAAGATSGMAGLGAAIGAVALPVAAVVAAFTFFRKKTKELDAGLRITIDGMDTAAETFRKIETRRFWGLSKKTSTSYDRADDETQDALSKIVGTIQTGVLDAAKALGIGADTFASFAHVINISTKGMSEEEAQKAVQEALGTLGDEFAAMIPGLEALAKDGETTTDALKRLSSALLGVNTIMDTLGHRFHAVGISGADMASKIADAFGGMDAMASATQAYYAGFYSDAERLTVTTRQSRKALAEMNLAMPKSRDEYRRMVEAQDLMTKRGREVYAALISMSGAMDQILPQVAEFTNAMSRLNDRVLSQIDIVMAGLANAVKANQDAASTSRRAGTDIRLYLDKLRGTASALFNPREARDYNRQMYERALQAANGGDVAAAMRLPELASAYLESARGIASTREEAAIAQARVAAQLGTVAVRTDRTAVALDRVAILQGRQLDVLEIAKAYLATGNGLTVESRQALLAKLAGTDGVVSQANRELIRELGIGTGVTAGGISAIVGRLGNLDVQIARQANAAGTIVAGFNDALNRNPLNASVTLSGAAGLQGAMSNLRTSLEALRVAVVAERRRVETAVEQVTQRPPAPRPPAPRPAAPAARTGMNKYTFSNVNGMVRAVGPLGGVRHYSDMRHATQYLTGANFPNFEQGGAHKGGFRIVGERGPELEATGPSRIISHSQSRSMLDNSEVVAELRALRAEMAEVRAQSGRTAESTRDTFKTLREINSMGVRINPDQNKVSA